MSQSKNRRRVLQKPSTSITSTLCSVKTITKYILCLNPSKIQEKTVKMLCQLHIQLQVICPTHTNCLNGGTTMSGTILSRYETEVCGEKVPCMKLSDHILDLFLNTK